MTRRLIHVGAVILGLAAPAAAASASGYDDAIVRVANLYEGFGFACSVPLLKPDEFEGMERSLGLKRLSDRNGWRRWQTQRGGWEYVLEIDSQGNCGSFAVGEFLTVEAIKLYLRMVPHFKSSDPGPELDRLREDFRRLTEDSGSASGAAGAGQSVLNNGSVLSFGSIVPSAARLDPGVTGTHWIYALKSKERAQQLKNRLVAR